MFLDARTIEAYRNRNFIDAKSSSAKSAANRPDLMSEMSEIYV